MNNTKLKNLSSDSFMGSPERNINERNSSSVESRSVLSQSLTPTQEIAMIQYEWEFQKTQKYKDMLQKNFIKIKNNIDIRSMTQKAIKADLVRQEAFSTGIGSNKRSKRADFLLTKIIQNIEWKDIPKFEAIISKPIAEQIEKGSNKCSTLQVPGPQLSSSTLICNKEVLIDYLQPDDIEDLKDLFIEKSIIDMDENEEIITHPGFVKRRSKDFAKSFVEKHIINKASAGSFDCLVQFLRENRNERLKHILSLLKPESIENLDNVESGLEVNRRLTVDQIDSEVNVTGIDEKNFEISLKFEPNSPQTDKVCDRIVSTVKSKNHIIVSSFEGIITDSEKGSVIIHLTSLHKYTLQRIINSISNEQFSKVLELLFKDDEVKRILTPGNYKLKMAVRICEDKQILNEKPMRSTELTQKIADNRSFLIEEIDTLTVLERFRSQLINVEPGIEGKDRNTRARYIIDLAMSNITAAESFYSTLDKMPQVEERLTTYERVYSTDPMLVCKHILNKFSSISEEVDLADVRIVFVERKIFEDKELDIIEKEFHHDRRDVMAVFLTDVIKNGNDAMLTLVDTLYVIGLDALAESLISDVTDVFEETTVGKEHTNTVVQMKGQAFEEVLIASATFILRIAKGVENKSIGTTCEDLNVSNSSIVKPMYDRGNLQADAIVQLPMSTVTSSKEQESSSLADIKKEKMPNKRNVIRSPSRAMGKKSRAVSRTGGQRGQNEEIPQNKDGAGRKRTAKKTQGVGHVVAEGPMDTTDFSSAVRKRHQVSYADTSNPAKMSKQSGSRSWRTSLSHSPSTSTKYFGAVTGSSYHKPLRKDSSYKLKNEQYGLPVRNTLRHYQPETLHATKYFGAVTGSSYHKPLRKDSSYKLKNEQCGLPVRNTLRHYQPETLHAVWKRNQVPYADTSNPAKMSKQSGSRSWPKSLSHSPSTYANATPSLHGKRTECTSTKDDLEKSFSDKTINVVVSPPELNAFVGASCQFNATIWSTNSEIKKIEWLHLVTPDETIKCDLANTDKYNTDDQPSLSILSLEPADAGTYVCRASNSEETIDSEHIKLNVKEYTPKISNRIGTCTIDNELKTTLEFEFDVPEPVEIFLLFKKNDLENYVPGKVDENQHIFTCYFPICCSGKYELVVKTNFGAVHRQTIDLKIPSVDKQHLIWSFDNLRLKSQKDGKISTDTTTENIDSTQDLDESHAFTTDIQPESKEMNNDLYASLKKTNVGAVIALDVGTTHSRYAVLITETLSSKNKWEPVIEDSVPTAVLFKNTSKTYIACGDEALPEYKCAIENGEQESYSMFEKFKLELYKRMDITAEMKIKDGYGRPMLAIDVYTAVINDLKQRALMHTEREEIEESGIAWVMTVPDVWNKNARDFIQLSCERSGIRKEQLIIVDESIAIFTYFQNLQYFCRQTIISQNLDDKNYLLIDLGGGTCDITGYHVTADCVVRVPIKPTHIACGVDIACNAILDRISSMIGDRAMDCMKKEETSSFLQLKEACLKLCKTSENTLKLNVPIDTLNKLCNRFRLKSFEATVDDFGKTLSYGNWKHVNIDFKLSGNKLIVRKGLIDDSLKVVIGTVISEIKHILETQKAQNIDHFFIVGGFSSLLIVQNEIQRAFKDKSVFFANDKVYSSVKGALLYRCSKEIMEK